MLYQILSVVHLALCIFAAYEILTSSKPTGKKALWLLLVFLFPVIGLILYFLMGRGD